MYEWYTIYVSKTNIFLKGVAFSNTIMERKDYIADEQVVKRATAAVKFALDKKKLIDSPIVIYDRKTKKIYSVNADGTRSIVGERRTVGRYSERVKEI